MIGFGSGDGFGFGSGDGKTKSTKMKNKPRGATMKKTAKKKDEYVILRGHDSGVHAGVLVSIGREYIELKNSRRLWRWWGGSLSQVAVYGMTESERAQWRIGAVVPIRIRKTDVCEIIACQPAGRASIEGAAEWIA